ncbi:MAG: phosphonate ABC transporter ATP-binding protein [Alphaproteobacteria bacterium]
MLQLQNVRKTFGDKVAVDDVSLRFRPGEFVGILGRSGAGKSTLLRTINRMTDPTSGSIVIGDQEITQLRGEALRRWRRRCAMIFQQFNLCPRLDVVTNVLIGVIAERPLASSMFKYFSPSDRARAILELEALDMASVALQRAETLSGGQQQRDVLLADEPVASLDPVNSEVVMDTLHQVCRSRNIPVIVNLHSLEIARRYCDRVVAMSRGRVVFDDLPQRLTNDALDQIYGGSGKWNRDPAYAMEPAA